MSRRSYLRVSAFLAVLGLSVCSLALRAQDDNHHGRKYKAPPPSAHIEVTVLKAYNGKPIEDAHVIFHPTEGDRDTGSLEIKTNEDGKAIIDVIPIGDTVTLQIIADGYQTYGQSYKIDKPEVTMEVRMKRPSGQYSVYTNSNSVDKPSNDPGSTNGAGGAPGSGSNSTPPASGGNSSGSGGSGSSSGSGGSSGGKSNGGQSQPPPK